MQFSTSISLAIAAISSIGFLAIDRTPAESTRKPTALVGNPQLFESRFEQWKETHGSRDVRVPLAWSRAISTERTTATGRFAFAAEAGRITVVLENVPEGVSYAAWLVDDAAGTTAVPDASDRLVQLGQLEAVDGGARLELDLATHELEGFDLDMVVISSPGSTPIDSIVLAGMPGLFQRLYSRELENTTPAPSGVVLRSGGASPESSDSGTPDTGGGPPGQFAYYDLVAEGEKHFFQSTFDGNGRTCGTCHPAENNFTIEPAFIATLPDSDPLFVAEFVPDLMFDLNGGLRFENPILMREFGLIVENLDGFDDLRYRFTMRSVQHTLGLTQTITSPDGPGVVPEQRTGWSGDGAPGQGTLRDFALGAVRQHFTKTMGRVPGVDFVFPSSSELDAFQLSLGRQQELDLSTLTLLDAGANEGRVRFDEVGCTRCHENAGANRASLNFNFNTGVEAFGRHNPDGTGELRPPDGGMGTNAAGDTSTIVESPEFEDPDVFSFGNKTFNSQSLVEFADTVPGFHNNITNMGALADTVEGAISFYRTAEFENSVDGFAIPFQGNDIDNIGRFLRVINALENRRSADDYAARADDLIQNAPYAQADLEHLLVLAQAECTDGVEVLSAVGLHPIAVKHFLKAHARFELAKTGTDVSRIANIQAGRNHLNGAKTNMQL